MLSFKYPGYIPENLLSNIVNTYQQICPLNISRSFDHHLNIYTEVTFVQTLNLE